MAPTNTETLEASTNILAEMPTNKDLGTKNLLLKIPVHDSLVGGRLAQHKEAWSLAPRWQRSVVNLGVGWKFLSQPPNPPPPQEVNPKLEEELMKYLKNGVIVESTTKPKWFCRLFTRNKPDGSLRVIADLSTLNNYIQPVTFRMPSITDLQKQLSSPKWLAKIDIEDAYLHIPVKKFFQSFLGIKYKNKFYQYAALPFGLSAAPAIFSGIIGHPIKLARDQGVKCLAYLDDIIIWENTPTECQKSGETLMKLLHNMGFQVHPRKSILNPSQNLTWLGIEWDAKTGSARYPVEAAEKLAQTTTHIIRKSSCSRREMESLLGKMAFIAQISPIAQIQKKFLGPMLRNWFPKKRDTPKQLTNCLIEGLIWWTETENISMWNTFRRPKKQEWVWSDASLKGWGGHNSKGKQISGLWKTDLNEHINLLELRTVRFCINSNLIQNNSTINIHTDNQVAFHTIQNWGSTRSQELTQEMKIIHKICMNRQLKIVPHRIPGKLNVVADALSRTSLIETEWEIHPNDWERICNNEGEPKIDLFSTPFNAKTELYVTPFEHPEAYAVNTFMQEWKKWDYIYLFPPVMLIPEVLLRMENTPSKICLITKHSKIQMISQDLRDRLISTYQLKPPRQLIQGKWTVASNIKSSPWVALIFSTKSIPKNTVTKLDQL